MLHVEHLTKNLGDFAIQDVSFDVADGEYFVLLGASGVGKTVLVETLAGLIAPDAGQVRWDGADITHERIQKRRMGLVYQDQALFPHMTVFHNIAYGLRAPSRTAHRERVRSLAAGVGAGELLDRYPPTLSGGEAQRVALARALATEPRCLLLDEPISSLDMRARSEVRALLRGLHRKGHTIMHVTHDYEEAMALASRVGIMEHGTIVQTGTPEEIFHHPKSEFVARFVGIRNFFSGRLEGPARGADGLARFMTDGAAFAVLSDAQPGLGFVILRSEDVTLSKKRPAGSARNCFQGEVLDLAPARLGVEVIIDIGIELAALLTAQSVERLALECGTKVWASFKATAVRFIEE